MIQAVIAIAAGAFALHVTWTLIEPLRLASFQEDRRDDLTKQVSE